MLAYAGLKKHYGVLDVIVSQQRDAPSVMGLWLWRSTSGVGDLLDSAVRAAVDPVAVLKAE